MRNLAALLIGTLGTVLAATACSKPSSASASPGVIRVGHFPNVTHAHALVAHHTSRAGGRSGWFETRTGAGVQWFVYNAGPSAMEALVAGSIDLAYVGPNPAINAHLRSGGRHVRVVAGATRGGTALVVPRGSGLRTAHDFRGKRIATPQLGNTQDVAYRTWLMASGLRVTQTGGDVSVLPTENPDQLALFRRGDVHGVWTVEPWVSRLELEGEGEILEQDRDSLTTVLVASVRFLEAQPALARAFVAAHDELTGWLTQNGAEAMQRIGAELAHETTRAVPAAILERCWPRLRFSSEVDGAAFTAFADAARRVGFLRGPADVGALVTDVRAPEQPRR